MSVKALKLDNTLELVFMGYDKQEVEYGNDTKLKSY